MALKSYPDLRKEQLSEEILGEMLNGEKETFHKYF